MNFPVMPTVNACFNCASAILLFLGYIEIKRQRQVIHKRFMLSAMGTSALFLIGYLAYHAQVGSIPYPYHDWTRVVYFMILIPHSILAGLMVPFILAAVYFALKGKFAAHARVTKFLWPVWMFVSVSGIVVYLMLYVF